MFLFRRRNSLLRGPLRGLRSWKVRFVLLLGLGFVLVFADFQSKGALPPLKDGDLVFQTSKSSQSAAIFVATANPFTHMGIVRDDHGRMLVIEAGATVREVPLESWVKRGVMGRVAVYRDPTLTREQAERVLEKARALFGRPYDIFFAFDNEAIYCSELPYLAYGAAGIAIGRREKVRELHFDNALVRKLIETRWRSHPRCKADGYDFERCFQTILDQEVVSPASIAQDPQFRMIYSNYPLQRGEEAATAAEGGTGTGTGTGDK